VRLLAAVTAFAFERERLEEEGISLLSSFDERFPERLIGRLGAACPPFLSAAGPMEWLSLGGLGVVGSRAAQPEALAVARAAGDLAAHSGRAVVSGLARGIDQESMAGALDSGGPVVGIPSEGLRLAARSPDVRRRVHRGELCIASPYGPDARFSAGNALGRNKIIFGLADVTFVVCADDGSGGTWGGSSEALRRGFGPVNVWMGAGQGAGNASLAGLGGQAITDVSQALVAAAVPVQPRGTTS
jgi:predicted Rossmann fold nucleotide-binding protein DprA/Smf involved in DNA uptake